MSEALVAGNFVRSAYRLPAPLVGSVSHTAKAQYDSVRAVMEADQVYSHFEMSQDGKLRCTFGTQRGVLLGETVRDWFEKTRSELDHYLWCEKMGTDYAMVCILDGEVVKESFEDQISVGSQMRLMVKRIQDHCSDFIIFLHDTEQESIDLDEGLPVTVLEDSILEYIRATSQKSLPRLHKYGKALSKITRARILVRIIVVGILSGLVVVPGTWYGAHWYYGEMPEAVIDDFEVIREQNREYNQLLKRPDISTLLPSISQASRDVVTSAAIADGWYISEVSWNYGESVRVVVEIPEIEDVLGNVIEIPSKFKKRLQDEADARGWQVQVLRTSATVWVPIEEEPRSAFDADRLRVHEPKGENERWHPEQFALDTEAVGELVDGGVSGLTNQYYFRSFTLNLHEDPWFNGETAIWASRKLTGGPLLLDSVTLRASPDSHGGLMDGAIKFRLLWRTQ